MLTKKQKLEALSEAFKEIEAYFELNGFFQSEEAPQKEAENEEPPPGEVQNEEEEQEEEYDIYYDEDEDAGGVEVFQREDVEVAIDVFISSLVGKKVFRIRSGSHPSLDYVFEKIFGEDHEIIKLVAEFDEHIEGYFGAIGYDDMRSAYGEVLAIRDIINKEIA